MRITGRIATIQHQARELGRLRTGFTDTSGKRPRPVRSETWIVTSHAQHYVEAAAALWGGKVEQWNPQGGGAPQYRVFTEQTSLDAIMPTGDPLSQGYEMWSAGGCTRRCDGITETLANKPCLCLAQFGEQWYEQGKETVCAATSRLNVFLPDMPDVGVFRAETHSYYAAGEIAGAVDLIRTATGGEQVLPIKLRIEQRQRKAGGQTKKFPVIVVELRGVTTGQVLAGTASAAAGLDPSAQRQQITAGGAAPNGNGTSASLPSGGNGSGQVTQDEDSTLAAIAAETDVAALQELYRDLVKRKVMTDRIKAALTARAAELSPAAEADAEPPNSNGAGDAAGDDTEDVDDLWRRVLASAPKGWSTTQLEEEFAATVGVDADKATAANMLAYLDIVGQNAGADA